MTRGQSRKEMLFFEIIVGCVLFYILFMWGAVQPIGNQPDELTRYMIPYYIFSNGKLPNGNLEELLVRGYGISYGFFPCLPYMCMAPVMKLVSIFVDGSYWILMGARLVNMIAGVVTYGYVRKIAGLLFDNIWTGWLFTMAICFWPQVMFIFTYTNCDAFAFMSCGIIVYAVTAGLKNGWSFGYCLTLAVGISICLLSYFNAYGMVVAAALIFVLSFVRYSGEEKKNSGTGYSFDFSSCLKIGLIILITVFLLSGWWFIRNAILYDGDFIGMRANRLCAEANAADYLKPSVRDTLKNNGESIFSLLKDESYMFLLKQSFFGRFGNMELAAPNYIIRFFKLLLAIGAAGLVLPCKRRSLAGVKRFTFDLGMAFAFAIPVFLCFWYSYANDYQPQGRYILPGLIPLMCIVFMGIRNIGELHDFFPVKYAATYKKAYKWVCMLCIAYILVSAWGCLQLVVGEYMPLLPETLTMEYTGNLYE